MSGDFRSIGFTDNNNRVQYLRVPNLPSDDIVSAEQGATIVLLDRIATALDLLVEILRERK